MEQVKTYARSVAADRRLCCYPPDNILKKVKAQVERTQGSASEILVDALRCYYEKYPEGVIPKAAV